MSEVSKAIPTSAQTQWVEIAQGKKRKLPRVKPLDELDRLIAWYEQNRPDMPRVMPGGIAMTAKDLDKFATKVAEGVWMYKGWRVAQADMLPRAEKRMKINKPRKRRAVQP